jgi:hypothetical protein
MISNEKLVSFLKKNPVSVISAVVALACAGAMYIRSSEIPDAEAAFEQKSAEGHRLTANIKNAAQLNDQLAVLAKAARQNDVRLLRLGELAKNLQFFYKLEAETGTKLLDLRQNTAAARTVTKTEFLPVSFNVSVQGEYRSVLEFMRRLEVGAHFSRVLSATISSSGADRSGPVTLTLGIELLGQP